MEETRIGLMNQSVRELIGKEREIAPIIEKCVDSIEEAVNEVLPEADTAMVAEKYKVNSLTPVLKYYFVLLAKSIIVNK